MSAIRLVLLPGTGSDEVFIRAAFGPAAQEVGADLRTPAPVPGPGLAESCRAALDAAAQEGPVVVGGVSLGAHLGAEWAVRNPDRCAGLLAVLPGWLGEPEEAPAALAARASADSVRGLGLDRALELATEGVPDWLAGQLRRAWPRYGGALEDSLRAAATEPAPVAAELAGITAPAVVVGCTDDPVHPIGIAREWAGAIPDARLRTVSLAEIGADLGVLGKAALGEAEFGEAAPG
ncbi:alpha/beta fold hydrolase [Sciscionella marina]|uniref:alpha/beta fold hydrolase n=1 Tax=Sciscionella marina TaxID=508770 RepID=UPI0003A3C5EA|nr:alpha/beta hydrolase [Sciscionella marina]